QRDALRIATTGAGEPHGDIEYRALLIAPHETEKAVVNVLRFFEARGAMIFCATREAVRRLHGSLLERGFAAVALSGELSQAERNRAIQALRDGRARACVATDVAARGLDLPDLGLVIHAELPRNREGLLHRSGRTGRAGRKGTSVLLVPHSRRRTVERLLAAAGVAADWSPPPSADAIRQRDQDRLAEQIEALAAEASEEENAAARLLTGRYAPEVLAAAVLRLSRAQAPAPEELADGQPEPERAPRRGPEDAVWFRMNVGRNGNADPRWVLPFLCRRGRTSRKNIGDIRIFERETWVEVARSAAAHFDASVRLPDPEDATIRIEPAPAGQEAPEPQRGGRRPPAGPRGGSKGGKQGRVYVRKRMHTPG
ncbi:MAG TPA: DEAD/DEAH box helicase, partial [Alphaproteobacteria bacterium]|nr:DEAD/DEAH box helicase [Alphaproteobacteria bacterium]